MKVKLQFEDGNSETWEVDRLEHVYATRNVSATHVELSNYSINDEINTHLEISRGIDSAKLKFISEEELNRFHSGGKLCQAKGDFIEGGDLKQKEVFVSTF